MKNFALLDENNLVVNVSVADGDWDSSGWVEYTGKNCGIGFTYNAEVDMFIAPQPYPSWSLDDNYDWQPPTPRPIATFAYWDESTLSWIEIETLAE